MNCTNQLQLEPNRQWKLAACLLLALSFACDPQPKPAVNSNQSPTPGNSETASVPTYKLEKFCTRDAVAGQVLVKPGRSFNSQNPKMLEALAKAIADQGVTAEPVGEGDVVMVRWSTGESIASIIEKMRAPNFPEKIEFAEPDYIVPLDCDEPASGNNEHLREQWGLDRINACRAWSIATGTGVITVVLDSGIDCQYDGSQLRCHEDLQNNIWLPPQGFSVRLGTKDVTCPGGCFGFDATVSDSEPDSRRWYPTDPSGHGTHIAGIIAASAATPGIVGVSFNSKILVVRYATSGYGPISSIKRAADFIIAVSKKESVRVINCSFGFDPHDLDECDSQILKNTFENLSRNNLLVVASNGNRDEIPTPEHPHYPSGYPLTNIIAVAPTTREDEHFTPSAYDPRSQNLIGAPGDVIFTTRKGGGYETDRGSSFAAPFVTGAAALVLSSTNTRCNQMSAQDLRTNILSSADLVTGLRTYIQNGRRLNVYSALMNCAKD